MKKLLFIFLSILILTASTGIIISTHFCGGKPTVTQIVIPITGDPCGCNGEMPDGCCKNEIKYFRVSDSFMLSVPVSLEISSILVFTSIFHSTNLFPEIKLFNTYIPSNHSPPLRSGLFLAMIQSFLL